MTDSDVPPIALDARNWHIVRDILQNHLLVFACVHFVAPFVGR